MKEISVSQKGWKVYGGRREDIDFSTLLREGEKMYKGKRRAPLLILLKNCDVSLSNRGYLYIKTSRFSFEPYSGGIKEGMKNEAGCSLSQIL